MDRPILPTMTHAPVEPLRDAEVTPANLPHKPPSPWDFPWADIFAPSPAVPFLPPEVPHG